MIATEVAATQRERPMKQITAIIKPFKLDEVREVFSGRRRRERTDGHQAGVKGFGPPERPELYRGASTWSISCQK